MIDHWSSHIPIASLGTPPTQEPELSCYRMEAGDGVFLRTQNVACLHRFQIWAAIKTRKQLPYTFVYLLSVFILADASIPFFERVDSTECSDLQGFDTTVTLVAICQNDQVNFSFLRNTYFGLAQAFPSIFSLLGFWYIQSYWKISTKKMICSCYVYVGDNP